MAKATAEEPMDELDFLIEHRTREKEYLAAKEEGGDAWREAKNKMREWRQHWREIRAAFAPPPAEGDAVATPETLSTKAEGKSV
jgi:hypothetical protein